MANVFDAAREGDIESLKKCLAKKPDLSKLNKYKLSALHCAAAGSSKLKPEVCIEVMKILIEAGSPLETKASHGRTPLIILAEFSNSVEPVQFLIDAGANPNVYYEGGVVHIVKNAKHPKVKELLSKITGVPISSAPEPETPALKMKPEAWKKAQAAIDKVFDELENSDLILLQDAGITLSDGMADCSELYNEHPNKKSIIGYCFYTRQDLDRAKKSSELLLAFGSGPKGKEKETIVVGELIVKKFKEAGFDIQWNGKSSTRPSVYLHKFSK